MLVSTALPGSAAAIWFQAVAWASISVFTVGMHHQRAIAAAWRPVAAGFALFAIGDLLVVVDRHVADLRAVTGVAHVVSVTTYLALALGLSALVRTDPTDRGRTALIDAGILVTPIALAGWIYLVGPSVSDPTITWMQRVVAAASPLGDLLCVALVIRLVAGGSRRPPKSRHPRSRHLERRQRRAGDGSALPFVVGAVVLLLAADAILLSSTVHDDHLGHRGSGAAAIAAFGVLGAAGARPLRRADASRRSDHALLSTTRLVLLAAAALVTPLLLAVQWWRGVAVTVPLVVIGTVISFLLVVARMAGLVHALEFSRSQLRFEADHDLLTGLPNRQLFTRHLDDVLAAGAPGALLFVDLDRFKLINDTLGHQIGDSVLVEVADLLRAGVRSDDVVARLAGDEFVVLIPACTEDEAEAIAARLVDRLHVRRQTNDEVLMVTASVGMVWWDAGTTPDRAHQLVRAADHAMYEAKHAAGGRLAIARV